MLAVEIGPKLTAHGQTSDLQLHLGSSSLGLHRAPPRPLENSTSWSLWQPGGELRSYAPGVVQSSWASEFFFFFLCSRCLFVPGFSLKFTFTPLYNHLSFSSSIILLSIISSYPTLALWALYSWSCVSVLCWSNCKSCYFPSPLSRPLRT